MTKLQRTALRLLRIKVPCENASPVPRDTGAMTLSEWRKQEKLVEHAVNLRQNRVYRSQLEVLRVEHPGHRVYPDSIKSERTLGRIEGFQLCLDMLEAFALPIAKRETIESTFEPEPEDKIE